MLFATEHGSNHSLFKTQGMKQSWQFLETQAPLPYVFTYEHPNAPGSVHNNSIQAEVANLLSVQCATSICTASNISEALMPAVICCQDRQLHFSASLPLQGQVLPCTTAMGTHTASLILPPPILEQYGISLLLMHIALHRADAVVPDIVNSRTKKPLTPSAVLC